MLVKTAYVNKMKKVVVASNGDGKREISLQVITEHGEMPASAMAAIEGVIGKMNDEQAAYAAAKAAAKASAAPGMAAIAAADVVKSNYIKTTFDQIEKAANAAL